MIAKLTNAITFCNLPNKFVFVREGGSVRGLLPHARRGISLHNGDKMTSNMAELPSKTTRWQLLRLYA